MKLFLCLECQDVRKFTIHPEVAICNCGATKAWYLKDGLNARIDGEQGRYLVLGFSNPSLRDAITEQRFLGDRTDGRGRSFEAFIIPDSAPTVIHLN